MKNNECILEQYPQTLKNIIGEWNNDCGITYIDRAISSNWDIISKKAINELFFLRDILIKKQPEIERDFPHVIEKFQFVWKTNMCEDYFNNLIEDKRGNREGFPQSVFEDIMFLQAIFLILKDDKNVVLNSWDIANKNRKNI